MGGRDCSRIVFLCSGGGGNLRFVQRAIERGWIAHAVLCEVLTDRECPANAFASAMGIPNRVVDFSGERQEEVLATLAASRPELIVTTVHRILKEPIVAAFRGRLLNLHYSLLPAFGGAIGRRPVQAALEYGARFVGATAHEVNETVDGGRPVVQAVVPVRPQDSVDSLMDLVFRCGCIALGSAINARLGHTAASTETMLELGNRLCLFSTAPCMPLQGVQDETFWADVAANP